MTEQGLDIFDVNPALKQVAGKAVAARTWKKHGV